MTTNDRTKQPNESPDRATATETRRPYEAPRVTRKRSVQRATLFSGGGGPTGGGLTAGG